jgi:4-amino-4-deoxy-L-arabinose transferase-like glycosyltransferase
MLLTVTGVWLLAGEAFGRDRLLQVAAAGTATLAPMIGFVSGSVNPDAMLYAAWSIALWLGVRLLRRGASPGRAAALLGAVGVACVVKATSYALVPAALLALGVALWRGGRLSLRRRAVTAGAAAVGILATLGVWIGVAHALHRAAAAQVGEVSNGAAATLNVREIASYLWQFYLPRLPFQKPFPLPSTTLPAYDIWFKQAWGSFGWLEVKFPPAVYVVLLIASVSVAAAAVVGLWRARRRLDPAVLAFLTLAGLVLLAGLHWTEYRYLAGRLGPFNSGRYLLPMIGVPGLLVAQAARMLRPARRPAAVAAFLGCMFVLDVASLLRVLERFYG